MNSTRRDPETGATTESAWLKIPARDRHMKDPLGLAYYRRLSLTEMTVYTQQPGDPATAVEQHEASNLRKRALIGADGTERIPLAPGQHHARLRTVSGATSGRVAVSVSIVLQTHCG